MKWLKKHWWRVVIGLAAFAAIPILTQSLINDIMKPKVVITNPNCEAWFESKGTGASVECPEIGIAVVAKGENCRYALQNHKEITIKCDNLEVKGTIK